MAATKGHGTPAGYKAGCKSRGGCPGIISCADAQIRYNADAAFRRGIDAGLDVELILEADAPAVAERPKPKPRPKPADPVAISASYPDGVDAFWTGGAIEDLPDALLELPPAPAPTPTSAICEATITRGRGRARCDYPAGHAGAHVGQFGNGTIIDWPNRPDLDDDPEIVSAVDPIPFSEQFPPDGGPLASTLEPINAGGPSTIARDGAFPIRPTTVTPPAVLDLSEDALEVQPLVLDLGDPFNGRHLLGCAGDDGCVCPPVAGLLEALVAAERRPGNTVLITHELRAALAETLDQLTRLVLLRENAYAQLLTQNARLLKAAGS